MPVIHRHFYLPRTTRLPRDPGAPLPETIAPLPPSTDFLLASSLCSSSTSACSRSLVFASHPAPRVPASPIPLCHTVPTPAQTFSPAPSNAVVGTDSPSDDPASAFPSAPESPLVAGTPVRFSVTNRYPGSSCTAPTLYSSPG